MTINPAEYLDASFGDFSALIAAHGVQRAGQIALDDGEEQLSWADVDVLTTRMAAQLRHDGLQSGQAVAILGTTTVHYALAYLAAIRAGGCAAPLTTSAAPKQLEAMMADSGAMHLFVDAAKLADMAGKKIAPEHIIMMDGGDDAHPDYRDWMAAQGTQAKLSPPAADAPFNIIYSSGTTGTPKGIVHSHQMRWRQYAVGENSGYGADGQATMLSTPLYSNTTLGVFLPTIAYGGTAHLMRKFSVAGWLERAQAARVTHTMLVPVQYKRLMEFDRFDQYDLSSMQLKYCTSAPFAADLKAQVLQRMPGGLVEIYSMTEGGVVCLLMAHAHPDKLHTVGIPWGGSEVFTINEEGERLSSGEIGELVGRSSTMMNGYQNQPEKTEEASWYDGDGARWQRMGDIGRVDDDGFVELLGRSKDMIISGGFNIYPVDLEIALLAHPDVADAAVIGVDSERWGETPYGFIVGEGGADVDCDTILAETNAQLGKTQRLSALQQITEMPRSHIGKLLKTELRKIAAN